jgi:hypothetical protein
MLACGRGGGILRFPLSSGCTENVWRLASPERIGPSRILRGYHGPGTILMTDGWTRDGPCHGASAKVWSTPA